MNRTFARLLGTALAICALQGCQHACRQPSPPLPPPPVVASPAPGPPAAYPVPPQAPQAPQALPEAAPAPVPPPAAIRGYEPPLANPAEPSWRPSPDSGVRTAPPEDVSSPPPQAGARLQPPQFSPSPPPATRPQPPQFSPSPPPATRPQPPQLSPSPPPANGSGSASAATPLLPAGIPQFAIALDQVATGLKPMLDGVEWLKQNGYRAVLHLRQPGEDDAADRRLFEMRGLKYLSLQVSPQTLSRTVVEEFNRIVGDRSNRPLFIYDKDGPLTGGLWYLYFRAVEHLGDDEARTRAARLGLREAQDGLQREMWLAIQKYLNEAAP